MAPIAGGGITSTAAAAVALVLLGVAIGRTRWGGDPDRREERRHRQPGPSNANDDDDSKTGEDRPGGATSHGFPSKDECDAAPPSSPPSNVNVNVDDTGTESVNGSAPVIDLTRSSLTSSDKRNVASPVASPSSSGDDSSPDAPLTLHPIATIRSVYRLCVGTPRQGLLAPHSRGTIVFRPNRISSDSVLALDGYSHLWIVFAFHLNSNATVVAKATRDGGRGGGVGGGGRRQFPSKISPPALGGKKVGVFATRSPHRPNPVGFTLCQIDDVVVDRTTGEFRIDVSGLDLVDGTPVLDVKPYVPHYDSVGYRGGKGNGIVVENGLTVASAASPAATEEPHAMVPDWVSSGLNKRRSVTFTSLAITDLRSIVLSEDDANGGPALEFYGIQSGRDSTPEAALEAMRRCIEEVLSVDVRSAYQTNKARKGKFQAERAKRIKEVLGRTTTTLPSTPASLVSDDDGGGCAEFSGPANEDDDQEKEEETCCTQQLDNLLIQFVVSDGSSTTAGKNGGDGTADETSRGSGAEDIVTVRAVKLLWKTATTAAAITRRTRRTKKSAQCAADVPSSGKEKSLDPEDVDIERNGLNLPRGSSHAIGMTSTRVPTSDGGGKSGECTSLSLDNTPSFLAETSVGDGDGDNNGSAAAGVHDNDGDAPCSHSASRAVAARQEQGGVGGGETVSASETSLPPGEMADYQSLRVYWSTASSRNVFIPPVAASAADSRGSRKSVARPDRSPQSLPPSPSLSVASKPKGEEATGELHVSAGVSGCDVDGLCDSAVAVAPTEKEQ